MKNILLIMLAVTLSILPLHPYIRDTLPLARRSWNELELILAAAIIAFYVYTIFSHSNFKKFPAIPLSLLLTIVVIVSAVTGYIQPLNSPELFRLLMIIWLIPFIKYLLQSFDWKLLASITVGILTIHSQWGIAQFILQHDLSLTVLGETILSNTDTSGIANFNINEYTKIIRAYGPYAHPNILGGSLVIGFLTSLLLLINLLKNKPKKSLKLYDPQHTVFRRHLDISSYKNISMALMPYMFIIILGLILSFSRAALLSIILCLPIMFIYQRHISSTILMKFTPIILITVLIISPLYLQRSSDPLDVATSERFIGYTWNMDMFINDANWGHTGPGQYIEALNIYLNKNNINHDSWQVAQVHSVPLLFITEWGWLSTIVTTLILIISLTKYSIKKIKYYLLWIIPLLPILTLDHYLLTQTAPLVWLLILLILYHQVLLSNYEIDSAIQSSD